MNIVMLDNTNVSYDGFTSLSRPLGGAQKAFASLAGALTKFGNRVTVLNNCKHALMADGARWRPLGQDIPQDVDLVIALRDPSLFKLVPRADSRVLWVVDEPKYLGTSENASILSSFAPRLMFLTDRQAESYKGRLSCVVVSPGVNKSFINSDQSANPIADPNHSLDTLGEINEDVEDKVEAPPPVAIITTNPKYGLISLFKIWKNNIQPENPDARLKVFSSVLFRSINSGKKHSSISELIDYYATCKECNIEIISPKGDREMAKEYHSSRVHLYQSNKLDLACWTLRDSQAAKLPAISTSLGGVEDVIVNSKTGYIIPDEEALVNICLRILSDDNFYFSLKSDFENIEPPFSWEKTAEIVSQIWL
tara:strand:- start:582 stop:1679 length:1098 start_codon:yes stop_codon:yes gene_type:complete